MSALKKVLTENGYTIQTAAASAALSPFVLYRWTNRRHHKRVMPNISSVRRLAQGTGIDFTVLLEALSQDFGENGTEKE